MSKSKKDFKKIINQKICFFLKSPIGHILPDTVFLKAIYRLTIHKKLNIKNPKSFNEKMQWLKLNDRRPKYITMADKHAVKEYVSNIIGSDYIIPTLGIWDSFDDIDFDQLPNKFVLKCTHDSGGILICKDKNLLNKSNAKALLERSLKTNYYYKGREWQYKDVPPKIIAEQFMETENDDLQDYKFMCFNGKVKCCLVCTDRNTGEGVHMSFLDNDWKIMPFKRPGCPPIKEDINKPYNYEKMIELAERLSAGIPFVRVDFYEANKKIYFGELTFHPSGGFKKFEPEEWDNILGSWIQLN